MNTIIYVKRDNQARIVCDCGLAKTIDMSKYGRRITEAKIKCSKCGKMSSIKFEYRRHYRKLVQLFGTIILSNNNRYDVQINDVSMTGVSFVVIGSEGVLNSFINDELRVGHYLKITFRLDDAHKSKIDRIVVIRRIQDKDIGAEFCDNIMDSNLGFYLMP